MGLRDDGLLRRSRRNCLTGLADPNLLRARCQRAGPLIKSQTSHLVPELAKVELRVRSEIHEARANRRVRSIMEAA